MLSSSALRVISTRTLLRATSTFRQRTLSLVKANPLLVVGGHRLFSSSRRPTPPKSGALTSTILAASAGASLLAGKGKFLVGGLKILKLKPLLTMAVSTWAYSLFFGWPFAAGMVGLIFVHECGHCVAMKYYGVPFSPMVFVPFIGAAVSMEQPAKDAWEEGIIALGGPILGTAGAVALQIGAEASSSQLMFALADFGYMVNLFNLLPVGSMDGGRVANAISPVVSGLGLCGGGLLAYQGSIANPIFYLILLSGAYGWTSRVMGWEEAQDGRSPNSYRIGTRKQAMLTISYGGLVGLLLALMAANQKKKKTPKQLEHEQKWGGDETIKPWADDDFRLRGSGGFDSFGVDDDDDDNDGNSWR